MYTVLVLTNQTCDSFTLVPLNYTNYTSSLHGMK